MFSRIEVAYWRFGLSFTALLVGALALGSAALAVGAPPGQRLLAACIGCLALGVGHLTMLEFARAKTPRAPWWPHVLLAGALGGSVILWTSHL